MMAEQAVTATWQSCKVLMLHKDKNADHYQSCHKTQQTNFTGYSHHLLNRKRLKMELDIEVFLPVPKPQVRFYGAAAHVRGRALANILEFTASRNVYLAEIELPQVQFCNGEIDWAVNRHGEVTIEGKLTPGAIFANTPIGRKTKRIKLCPSEPWGMSFNFPGPVDQLTSDILFTSKTVMEITAMKAIPAPVLPIVPNPAGVDEIDEIIADDEIDEIIAELLA